MATGDEVALYYRKLSDSNLRKTQAVLSVALDHLELHGVNRLTCLTIIPFKKFQENGVDSNDVGAVLSRIDGCSIKSFTSPHIEGIFPFPTKMDFTNNLFLEIKNLDSIKKVKGIVDDELERRSATTETEKRNISENASYPKSIHLITVSVGRFNTIFLVLDEQYEIPTRFAAKNRHDEDTYIKKLYNIAYLVDVLDKKVGYDKALADSINNKLFNKTQIKRYMKTNKLEKPTLVKKSEDKNFLVLTGEVPVTTELVNKVPTQFQHLYKEW